MPFCTYWSTYTLLTFKRKEIEFGILLLLLKTQQLITLGGGHCVGGFPYILENTPIATCILQLHCNSDNPLWLTA